MARTAIKLPVKKISEIDRPRSWAVYGRSGTGKTTFAGSFPGPILYLDIRDRGTDSIADVKNIEVMEVEDWDEFEDVLLALQHKDNRYKTVVFDTISQMQSLALEHVLAKNKKKVTSRIGDWGTLTKREWGDASALMKEAITNFRDLPLEVVFLAQERVSHDDDADDNPDNMIVPEVGPALMKSVATHLNASVSIIANTFIKVKRTVVKKDNKKIEKESTIYCLRLGAHPVYTTKVRKAKSITAPPFIEDPSYEDVVDIIEEVPARK